MCWYSNYPNPFPAGTRLFVDMGPAKTTVGPCVRPTCRAGIVQRRVDYSYWLVALDGGGETVASDSMMTTAPQGGR